MSRTILPDDLWTLISPLLPPDKPAKSNGRPPIPNRKALTGILFVLRTGIPWEYLPQELYKRGQQPIISSPIRFSCPLLLFRRQIMFDIRGNALPITRLRRSSPRARQSLGHWNSPP